MSNQRSPQLWQRASAEEYDIWGTELRNGPSWSFEGLVPYFRKAENWTEPPIVLPGQKYSEALYRTHGTRGPVQVIILCSPFP
jgi:choline dehydrogenase-like flavoprotein